MIFGLQADQPSRFQIHVACSGLQTVGLPDNIYLRQGQRFRSRCIFRDLETYFRQGMIHRETDRLGCRRSRDLFIVSRRFICLIVIQIVILFRATEGIFGIDIDLNGMLADRTVRHRNCLPAIYPCRRIISENIVCRGRQLRRCGTTPGIPVICIGCQCISIFMIIGRCIHIYLLDLIRRHLRPCTFILIQTDGKHLQRVIVVRHRYDLRLAGCQQKAGKPADISV